MAIRHKQHIGADIIVPFILIALVFGGLIWRKHYEAVQPPETAHGRNGMTSVQKIVLFFGNNNSYLSRETREIDYCDNRTSYLNCILEELVSGPVTDLVPVIPEWTDINLVKIEKDLAIVDLNKDFKVSLQPGSSSEMLAVYSVVNTICINMPEIHRVKITVECNNETHLSHLDLSDPLEPDYSLEQ